MPANHSSAVPQGLPAEADVAAARALLLRLAQHPRNAGSAAESDARTICTDELHGLGFDVREQVFEFSQFPGRWAPTIGAVYMAILAFAASHAAAGHSAPVPGLLILVGGFAILGVGGSWVARHGTTRIPWLRSRSVNLIATRADKSYGQPSRWLVAHLDTKSQTVPMLARIVSVILSVVLFAVLTVLLFASALALDSPPPANPGGDASQTSLSSMNLAINVVACLAGLSTIPMMLCIVGNRSRGALDNASGVAAVLMAARQLDGSRAVGVLISSAEELGLAGARAFVNERPGGQIALNCDTIDDDGHFICMMKGKSGASGLAGAIRRAAARYGNEIQIRGMLPGVLADNVAFSDAGWDSLTLSRGNIATLALVHTEGDRPDDIEGTGIAQAARLLAATMEELT